MIRPSPKCSIAYVRESTPTEDVKAIHGRLVSNGDIDLSDAPFDTALRLYPRTASVDEYESQIASLAQTTKLYTFEAEHAIL